ncbi:MAG: PKD domain-containing protein [Gemmatimonadales bacterium]
MSPLLKRSLRCLVGLAAACSGNGRDVAVDTPNLPPAAAFGSTCAALACTFTDSSTDADGRIATYRWSFGDGSDEATTRDAGHAYAAPGDYTVALRVTDDSGATDSTSAVARAVLPRDLPPVAAFGSACDELSCVFTDLSSDPDGQIVAYRWSFGDGSAGISRDAAHLYSAPGTYTIDLTVTDDRGASTTAAHSIDAIMPNTPPRAAFGSSCAELTCTFSDSSFDVDGTLVGHHWTFDDGEAADGPNPVHTYAGFGVYHVQLVVTDDRGATGDAALDVTAATPDHPAIGLSSRLNFCYHPGGTRNCVVLTGALRITGLGGKLPGWTATSDQPWIRLSPAGGTTPSDIHVAIDLTPLRPITPRDPAFGSIVVTAAGAFNSPLRIPVALYFH